MRKVGTSGKSSVITMEELLEKNREDLSVIKKKQWVISSLSFFEILGKNILSFDIKTFHAQQYL